MTKNENLLVVAAEECAEIEKEIMKALRFGLDGCHPDDNITNNERILIEYTQLRAVMDMLMEKQILKPLPKKTEDEMYRDKVEKVERWREFSQRIGIVN